MGKFYVRMTIIFVSIYLVLAYLLAQFYMIDILTGNHAILFEGATVIYCYSEGKYHCKYLKHCSLGIFSSDVITRADYAFDFLSVDAHNLIPIALLALGMLASLVGAIRHFIRVSKYEHRHRN